MSRKIFPSEARHLAEALDISDRSQAMPFSGWIFRAGPKTAAFDQPMSFIALVTRIR